MDLVNSFTVPADIETAWNTLLDVEAIAPCMPGATLTSVDGDNFTGNVKVKLGPVAMTYSGEATFLSKDAQAHVAVIEGKGKEQRGTGTATALVTTTLVSEGPMSTRVDVSTELTITGKAAQFGRGVMQDVAGKLVTQFADNLAIVIQSRMEPSAETADADDANQANNANQANTANQANNTDKPTPAVSSAERPAPVIDRVDSIDLLGTAGAPVLKRVVPVVVGVVVVVGIIWFVASRR